MLDLLIDLELDNMSFNKVKREVRFSREPGRNSSSVKFNLDTLAYYCFSTGERGNLYSLIMKKKGFTFPYTLSYIISKLGLNKTEFQNNIKLPFGGFYKSITRQKVEPEYSMQTYDEEILTPYLNKYNMMFFNDGISFDTQREFKVGFDLETLRITIPIWTFDGQLCGIMGRLNDIDCDKSVRWLPIIPCSRALTLYGFHRNYAKIQEKGLVIVGESEKFVQQLHSMGSGIGLATGGSAISETQAKYIKALMVPKVIIAYDEGLDEEFIREQAYKLKTNNYMLKNSVGYIWDESNDILSKNSKAAPTDLGKQAFQDLIKKKVRWLS